MQTAAKKPTECISITQSPAKGHKKGIVHPFAQLQHIVALKSRFVNRFSKNILISCFYVSLTSILSIY